MPVVDALPLADDLGLLRRMAHEAAEIALGYFRHNPKVWHKENASPVSEADYAVDRHLRAALLTARPGYGWLSEETEDAPERLARRRVFVVDPIDGTRGFLAGSHEWTISLAIVEEGQPLTAVLIQPSLGRVFSAMRGGGAFLAGEPLKPVAEPDDRTVRTAGPAALITRLRQALGATHDAGYVASLALRIAMVAEGSLDLALAKANACDWDIAAADLILAEAGGGLLDLEGRRLLYNRPDPRHPILLAGHPVTTTRAARAFSRQVDTG